MFTYPWIITSLNRWERIYQGLRLHYSKWKQEMQERWLTPLRISISPRRLEAYRQSANDTDLDLLACYTWNIMLSEALHPALHCLEIALRNSLHNTIIGAVQNTRWLETISPILKPSEQEIVRQAQEKLREQNKPIEEGRLVAELGFGFWTSLLDARYEQVLWPRQLKAAFPAMPRRIRTRRTLSRHLYGARYLRNRVSHHEPIWYWPDLRQQHDELLETIGWISPVLYKTIQIFDRFPEVYSRSHIRCREELEKYARSQGYIS